MSLIFGACRKTDDLGVDTIPPQVSVLNHTLGWRTNDSIRVRVSYSDNDMIHTWGLFLYDSLQAQTAFGWQVHEHVTSKIFDTTIIAPSDTSAKWYWVATSEDHSSNRTRTVVKAR
jgi:hypothetical protein